MYLTSTILFWIFQQVKRWNKKRSYGNHKLEYKSSNELKLFVLWVWGTSKTRTPFTNLTSLLVTSVSFNNTGGTWWNKNDSIECFYILKLDFETKKACDEGKCAKELKLVFWIFGHDSYGTIYCMTQFVCIWNFFAPSNTTPISLPLKKWWMILLLLLLSLIASHAG